MAHSPAPSGTALPQLSRPLQGSDSWWVWGSLDRTATLSCLLCQDEGRRETAGWAGHRDGQASGSASTEEQEDGPPLHPLTPLLPSCSSQGQGRAAHSAPQKVTWREQQMSGR